MHGRLKVKTSQEQEEERKIKERERAHHFRHLTQSLFDLRPKLESEESLAECLRLSTDVLLINPDFYTAWNIRREAILKHQNREDVLRDELRFTIDCLKKNEKSYSVWQHRIWCLSHLPDSEYKPEIQLCNNLLNKDERNFHCWDYRNYICDLAGAKIEDELKFTTDKINSNFSNFSAWHRRHKIFIRGLKLDEAECPRSCNLRIVWMDEYQMVSNALFTDPSDQSPWLYHNWLVKNNFGNFTQVQLDILKQLEELEPDNKWVQQALKLASVYQP